MKIGLIWIMMFFSSVIFSGEEFVMKVRSYPDDFEYLEKKGSGVVIKYESKYYVLTSDHVIYHGRIQDKITHLLLDQEENQLKLDLVAAHVGMGVALLSITSEQEELVKGFIDEARFINDHELVDCKSVTTIGVPYDSLNTNEHTGTIINSKSERHEIPLAKNLLEVMAHTEFGMSGGALMDQVSNKFLGIISHQYLLNRLGLPPLLNQHNTNLGDGDSLIGLIIPAWFIYDWIKKVVDDNDKNKLEFGLADQLKNIDSMTIDGLRFNFTSCVDEDAEKAILEGGDGPGIGGNMRLSRGKKCMLKISPVITSTPTQGWPFKSGEWFKTLKNKLRYHGTYAEYSSIWFKEKDKILPIYNSLIDFFKLIERGGIPIGKIYSPFDEENIIEESIIKNTKKLKELVSTIPFSSESDVNVFYFYNNLLEFIDLLETPGPIFEYIPDSKVKSLQNPPAWDVMYTSEYFDFDTMSNLRALLQIIGDQLNKIRVNI